jgi:acyl carrier protein
MGGISYFRARGARKEATTMPQDPSHGPAADLPPGKAARAEILSALVEILRDELAIRVKDDDAGPRTFESLDVDSLSLVEFAMAAEARFEVSIEDDEVRSLTTLNDVVYLIGRKLAART